MARYTTVQTLVDAVNAKIAELQASPEIWEMEWLISSGHGEPYFATTIVLNAFKEALPNKWLQLHGYYDCEIAKTIDGYDNRVRISFVMTHSHPYYPLSGSLTKVDLPVLTMKRKRMPILYPRGEKTKLCFYEAAPADGIPLDKTIFSFFTDAERVAFDRIGGKIEKLKALKGYMDELGPKKTFDFLTACSSTVFTKVNRSYYFSWNEYEEAINYPEKMDADKSEAYSRNVLDPHCFDKTFAMYEKDCSRFKSNE